MAKVSIVSSRLRCFFNIFLTCSVQVGNNLTVNGIDYYITDSFGSGMYESCKDVKFGTMNTRAMEFIGAGAKNFRGKTTIFISLFIFV